MYCGEFVGLGLAGNLALCLACELRLVGEHINVLPLGISGKHDVKEIKRELDTLPGVFSVTVSNESRVSVDFDTTGVQTGRIEKQLTDMGYQVVNTKTEG